MLKGQYVLSNPYKSHSSGIIFGKEEINETKNKNHDTNKSVFFICTYTHNKSFWNKFVYLKGFFPSLYM